MLMVTGCAHLEPYTAGMKYGLKAGPANRTSIMRAANSKQWEYITRVCEGTIPAETPNVKDYACKYQAEKDGPNKIKSVACDEVIEAYGAYQPKSLDFQHAAGAKYAECDLWTELFEQVVHWGNADQGVKVLKKLEQDGTPVQKEYVRYLQSHIGKDYFNLSANNEIKFSLDYIGKWLIANGHTDLCDEVVASASGSSEWAKVWTLPYLKKASCTNGSSIANELLLSDNHDHHLWACQTLGSIGGKRELKKTKVLSKSDPYVVVKKEIRNDRLYEIKIYPVREACLAESGKIEIRMK